MDIMDYMEQSTLHIKAPHDVHIGAKTRAAHRGVSMNQHVVDLIVADMEGNQMPRSVVQNSIKMYHKATAKERKTLVKAAEAVRDIEKRPDSPKVINSPRAVPAAIKEMTVDWTPCIHGVDPKHCKFSRPGKPCKAKVKSTYVDRDMLP